MKIKNAIFSVLILFTISVSCQQSNEILLDSDSSIKAEELREKLYIYSSDEFGGRGTPSVGQDLAVEYLINHYKGLGIESLQENTYKQGVELQFNNKPDSYLKINDKEFDYYYDYISYNSGPKVNINSKDFVYVGYGIDDPNYSDYKDLDVKGKIVIAIEGEPKDGNGKYVTNNSQSKSKWSNTRLELNSKKVAAAKNGATSLILIHDYFYRRYASEQYESDNGSGEKRMSLSNFEENNIHVLLFNPKHKKFLTDDQNEIVFNYEKNVEKFIANNVAAVIKGSEFPDEYIIITAHLDHEGIKDGIIYPGADDDGSGSVGMLEIAEAFAYAKKMGFEPKRSIIFLHVTAEERGLLGSKYYADYDPLVPLENTVANLNIDMIGRTDPNRGIRNVNYIYIIGSDFLSDDLHNINLNSNSKYVNLELDNRYNSIDDPNQFYYRSDHFHFVKNNVPAIFYFSGVHEDYHKPTDTADKILYDVLEKRIKLIFHTAWELANRDERIKLN